MNDFFYRFENALTKKQCLYFINLFNKDELKSQIIQGPINDFTKLTGKFFYEKYSIQVKPIISNILEKPVNEYKKKYPFLASQAFMIDSLCNLQRYQPGKSYSREHCENTGEPNQFRNLAWMIYLNDIKSGGGTYFPNQDLTLKPIAGDLYIWPAYWTHTHYGLPADEEVKFIITGWCRFFSQKEKDDIKSEMKKTLN